MSWVAGVDACRDRWFVVLRETDSNRTICRVIQSIADILTLPERPSVVAVDCPIGLMDQAVPGGRECDRAARGLLGPPRASSVFPIPVRSALSAGSYKEACAINAASSAYNLLLAKQTYALFPMLREMDEFITSDRQNTVIEAHPELCFYELNNERPMKDAKATPAGEEGRRRLLSEVGLIDPSSAQRPRGVAADDMLDAYVLCWTASRIASGIGKRVPEKSSLDARGLRMEMWR
jgi:predicted RNase H-like nuclease